MTWHWSELPAYKTWRKERSVRKTQPWAAGMEHSMQDRSRFVTHHMWKSPGEEGRGKTHRWKSNDDKNLLWICYMHLSLRSLWYSTAELIGHELIFTSMLPNFLFSIHFVKHYHRLNQLWVILCSYLSLNIYFSLYNYHFFHSLYFNDQFEDCLKRYFRVLYFIDMYLIERICLIVIWNLIFILNEM